MSTDDFRFEPALVEVTDPQLVAALDRIVELERDLSTANVLLGEILPAWHRAPDGDDEWMSEFAPAIRAHLATQPTAPTRPGQSRPAHWSSECHDPACPQYVRLKAKP